MENLGLWQASITTKANQIGMFFSFRGKVDIGNLLVLENVSLENINFLLYPILFKSGVCQ